MFDYFTNSILAAIFWSVAAMGEGYMGKKNKEVAIFVKFFILGLAAILFFFIFKKKITKNISQIWKADNKIILSFIASVVCGVILANYFYFTALEESANRAHIVVAVSWTLPIVFATIGMNLFLNEKTNVPSMIGIALIIAGIFILKLYNPVEKKS